VGWSYESILVKAPLDAVTAALAAIDPEARARAVGEDRTAVTRTGEWGQTGLARKLSADLSTGAVFFSVYDSDYLSARLYERGKRTHDYISEVGLTGTPFEDDDGAIKTEIGGRLYAPDDPDYPQGALGAEPGWLAPFGVGPVDLGRLESLLNGVPDEDAPMSQGSGTPRWLFAEQQHAAILRALHLDPDPLTDRLGD
jgi:hypothetical protein